MTKFHSHYESLNVTRDAPAEVIRAAYRSLSQKHHPDKNIGDQEAARMMARLNTAYSVLSDSEQRELYDLQLQSEQRVRETNYGFQAAVDEGSATVAYSAFTMEESARTGRAASDMPSGKVKRGAGALLHAIRTLTAGWDIRVVGMTLGIIIFAIIPIFWFIWRENQSMLRFEQAAANGTETVAVPDAERLDSSNQIQAPSDRAKTKPAASALAQTPVPSATSKDKAEPAKPVAAPAAPPDPSTNPKASEFERLTAMLKRMGLGLHKLELSPSPSDTKSAPAPAKAAEPAMAAEAARSSPASSPAAQAAKPPASPSPVAQAAKPLAAPEAGRSRDETERPSAAEAGRSETKLLADAGRAIAPTAATANTASASRTTRSAVIADARSCAAPAYPPIAYRNGETGSVLLALLVGSDGRVIESKVQKSSGFPELDKAARKALSLCKFKPISDGQGEPVWTTLNYVWSLD